MYDKQIQLLFKNQKKHEDFGKRLKYVMAYRQITSKQLSQDLFLSISTISGYCTGRRSPNIYHLLSLAKALNVSADYLIGCTDELRPLY